MPIYEYQCQECGHIFSHFWRSIQTASGSRPACPQCHASRTQRIISSVAVLGGMGGLTPAEQQAKSAQEKKLASITPKEQIEKFRAAKKKD